MASAEECEPIMGDWGGGKISQWGPLAEPLVRGIPKAKKLFSLHI